MAVRKAVSAGTGALQGAAAGSALGPIGSVVGGILGGVGGLLGGGESEQAKLMRKQAEELERELQVATPEERQFILERFQEIGALTPEMEQAILAGPSAYEQITTDPRLAAAQYDALARIQARLNEGGLTLEDRALLQESGRQLAQEARGREEAIQQNLQQRGMGGAGAEIAARLQASQSAADRAAQQGLNIGALAQRRLAESIGQQADLAGRMEQNQLGREQTLAQARDFTNRFNVENQRAVSQRNVASRNRAQETDLDYRRRLATRNTELGQSEAMNKTAARLGYIEDQNRKLRDVQAARLGATGASEQSKAASSEGLIKGVAGVGSVLEKGKEKGGFLTGDFWKNWG